MKPEELVERFAKLIDSCSPEETVTQLMNLITMKADFQTERLYRAMFKSIVNKLYLKVHAWQP